MANLLRYAVEIDLRGNLIGGAWEHEITAAGFGVYGGFLRACTGAQNLTIGGNAFRTGFLLEQFAGERQTIDITDGGNYATFSTLDFSLNNVGGFWDWLRAQGIFTKNAPVRFWAVEGATAFLRWVGVVDEDDFSIEEIKFSCIDASKTIHKTIPPETLNPAAFGWAAIEEESRGAAIPVSIGNLQEALLLPATKGENRFRGIFKDSTWEAVGHIAYFPSSSSMPTYKGAPNDLQQLVLCVGTAQFEAGAFAGKFLRAISGEGAGLVRRILDSSATAKIARWGEGDGAYIAPSTIDVFGVLITIDSAWAFGMVAGDGETEPPTTATDWNDSVSYVAGSICSYSGQVFRCLVAQAAGSAAPVDGSNWKAIYRKEPAARGDSAFCHEDSAINRLQLSGWVPVAPPLLLAFDSGVTILECFAFDATLLASQRAVSRIDIARNAALQRAGLRTFKDGAEISLPDIGEAFPSGLFSGRSYSGVRLSKASFAADKKVSASQRIGSVIDPFGVFMGAVYQGQTAGGQIDYTWKPSIWAQPNGGRLNDPDPAQYVGDEFKYSFMDSAGVTYSETGKFPDFSPNYATTWEIHSHVRTLPDAEEISGAKDIIPALRAKLFLDCPAAFSVRASYFVEIRVRSRMLSRLLLSKSAVLKSEVLSIGAAGTIEQEISLFSFFEKESEALFIGLLEAIKIDSVVQGKRLRDWLEYVEVRLIVRLRPAATFLAGVQPYLRIYEGGLAAKGEIDLGDFRASLQGEVWGNLAPLRFDPQASPANFPQVAEYLLRAYDGLGDSEIDTASIDSLLPVAGLQEIAVSRQIVDARNSRDYLIELAAGGMFGIISKAGKRAFRSWMDERTPVRAFGPAAAAAVEKIVDGSLQDVGKVPISKVPTEARLQFNYSTAEKRFKSEIFITRTWEESFPAVDAVEFGGSFVADIAVISPFAADLIFVGASPDLTFGDMVGFEVAGVQYVGQSSGRTTRPDGREVVTAWGFDSAQRALFELPAALAGQTYLSQPVAPLGGFLWQQYAQGFDASQYAEAREIWQRFRDAYKRVRQVRALPEKIGKSYWLHSSDIYLQDIGAAVLYLDRVSRWLTKPREVVAFEVQAEGNLGLSLLDPVTFEDSLLFGGSVRLGWLTEIYLLPNKGTIGLQVILDDDPLDPYPQAQVIDEGFGVGTIGNAWGEIDETATADTIDEQGA
jgi:hypothetical protein